MAFDELTVDQAGMTGRQTRWHAVLLLEFAHVGFDMVFDLEAIGFQMGDPFFAAAAIGVAVNFDGDQVGGLGQRRNEQGAQGSQTQVGSHIGMGLGVRAKERILTNFAGWTFKLCFEVLQSRAV
jgi:hypothetical protein